MEIEIAVGSTEYLANEIKFKRGSVADIVAVYHFHTTDDTITPTPNAFEPAVLVTGPPLQEGKMIDILTKVGPGWAGPPETSPGQVTLTKGRWQRWVAWQTADEFVIRYVGEFQVV